jgi:hypothetical protein
MKQTTNCHVVLTIRMCGGFSQVPMFLAPVHRNNCTFYFYWSHAPVYLCANWWGSVGEQTVLMTELTICELCLYHSAGAVSCDSVTVGNSLLAGQKSENYGWKILLNCIFSHHHRKLTVTKFLTACMSVTLLLLSCMTVICRCFLKIGKNDS